MIIMLEAKALEGECNETEPIYKSKYTIQPYEQVKPISCKVDLPEHNLFIPDDLSLLPLGQSKHPRKLYDSKYIEAFFKEDH